MQILEGLNKEQKKAVEKTEGPLLILAGAGSGKTKTLTHRVAHILQERKAMPEQILAVTFTNKAANEMRERIGTLLAQDGSRRSFMPFTGTFHGICVRLLRMDGEHIGVPSNFVIFDSADQKTAMKQAMKQIGVTDKKFNPSSILSLISGAKNELLDVQDYSKTSSTPAQNVAAEVWPVYAKILKEANALDFDDIIIRTVDLLLSKKEIRSKWQKQFRYILIDEYQDTNKAQYELIRLLVNDHKNICVVGDDWQSIYSWRGADYQNILNFEKDYKNTLVIKLEQNYRSTKPILDAAHKIITKNQNRSDKKIWTDLAGEKEVALHIVSDEMSEGELVVSSVKMSVDNSDYKYGDHAVLYRTNAQSRSIEEACLRYGVPYRVVGGVRFYDRKEIKDVMSYVRLIYQPDDMVSFRRIVNIPSRGIGATSINNFMRWLTDSGLTLSQGLASVQQCEKLTKRAVNGISKFNALIISLRNQIEQLKVNELIEHIINKTGIVDYYQDGSVQGDSKAENIKELISVAKEYEELGLDGFLEEVALVSDIDSYDNDADAIVLMTIHAAKGLEFPVVFMVGMEESVFPHSRSLFDPNQMEEERRLCYVGMTRAMRELIMVSANRRLLYGESHHNPPSRFLADIDGELAQIPKFSSQAIDPAYNPWKNKSSEPFKTTSEIEVITGSVVRHKIFGTGTVVEIEGDVATISFKGRGPKKLNIAFAPLEIVG